MRHVIFLDVDGVLLRFPSDGTFGGPTPAVGMFLEWLDEHFDVRWLTSWAVSGTMRPERLTELASLLNISESLLERFNHNGRWFEDKTTGIDIEEFRHSDKQFRWLDDEILDSERDRLTEWGVLNWWIPSDCNDNPDRLFDVWDELRTLVEST